jgi:hypothetical protein
VNTLQDLEEVTIRIPGSRVAELYKLAGSWRENDLASDAISTISIKAPATDQGPSWREGDDEIAKEVWSAGNDNARTVYRILVDAAGQPVAGEVLAQAVGMAEGSNRFPGLLGAIGRTTWHRHREVPWSWDPSNNTYAMPTHVVPIFAKAGIR